MKKINYWRPSTILFGGKYLCISHKKTDELCIASKYGEIWEYSDSEYSAIVRIKGHLNQIRELLNLPPVEASFVGSEVVIRFPKALLPKVKKILRITRNRDSMCQYANGEL